MNTIHPVMKNIIIKIEKNISRSKSLCIELDRKILYGDR